MKKTAKVLLLGIVLALLACGSVFAAQAIGAGHGQQLAAVTRTGMRMNLLLTGGLALLMFGAAP